MLAAHSSQLLGNLLKRRKAFDFVVPLCSDELDADCGDLLHDVILERRERKRDMEFGKL